MRADLLNVRDLEPADAAWIAAHLCRPGSEMQNEFYLRQADTPVCVIWSGQPVAWVATHEWHEHQTLEAFTDPDWRRHGLARIGALVLLSVSYLVRSEPVAVFSPDCVPLEKSLGFADVLQYQRTPTGWSLILG